MKKGKMKKENTKNKHFSQLFKICVCIFQQQQKKAQLQNRKRKMKIIKRKRCLKKKVNFFSFLFFFKLLNL